VNEIHLSSWKPGISGSKETQWVSCGRFGESRGGSGAGFFFLLLLLLLLFLLVVTLRRISDDRATGTPFYQNVLWSLYVFVLRRRKVPSWLDCVLSM